MEIVGGFDLHRRQMTYDWVDADTGEVNRGRIQPLTRQTLRAWLAQLPADEGTFAVEATTGWPWRHSGRGTRGALSSRSSSEPGLRPSSPRRPTPQP